LILSRSDDRAPARFGAGTAQHSLLCHGCTIGANALVERSVLAPGVKIAPGATVRESVILNDVSIGPGAVLERAIVDKRAHIGVNARIGAPSTDPIPRLAVVGKGADLPDGFIVHPGGEVAHDVIESDLETHEVPAGLSIYTRRRPWDIKR